MTALAAPRSAGRRLADLLHGRRRLQLGLLLSGPLGWLGVAYLGSLAVLFVAAFWHLDEFSGKVVHSYGASNFQTLWNDPVYRKIALRYVFMAQDVLRPERGRGDGLGRDWTNSWPSPWLGSDQSRDCGGELPANKQLPKLKR